MKVRKYVDLPQRDEATYARVADELSLDLAAMLLVDQVVGRYPARKVGQVRFVPAQWLMEHIPGVVLQTWDEVTGEMVEAWTQELDAIPQVVARALLHAYIVHTAHAPRDVG